MAQRDLKLNTLGRYGKSASRLVLEEHGHCEVPAGCGGVVLRWRNPDSGLNFLIDLYAAGEFQIFLDGAVLPSARLTLPFGAHIIAFAMTKLQPAAAALSCFAIHDDTQLGFPHTSRPSGRKISVLSAADGSWKYTTSPPADDAWMHPGFDDSQWESMVARKSPELGADDMKKYRLRRTQEAGAACLGIEGNSTVAWVRKSFSVDRPEQGGE